MKPLLETDEGRAWVKAYATELAAKEWKEKAAQAHKSLMVCCRQSTDPKVTAAYEKLMVSEEATRYLSGT